jgi:hypothetical protein
MEPRDLLDEHGRYPEETQAMIAESLEADRIARLSQARLDDMAAGPEKQMVMAVDELLSFNLGSSEGYLGSIGLFTTRKLQQALAAYGITPDYGQSIRNGRRTFART